MLEHHPLSLLSSLSPENQTRQFEAIASPASMVVTTLLELTCIQHYWVYFLADDTFADARTTCML